MGCSYRPVGWMSQTFPHRNLPIRSFPPIDHAKSFKQITWLTDFLQQLGHCLGRGAFGSVYCALNWSTGETVAIKQVRLSDMPKAELNVIMQEIDLLKNLNHPNIVKYHGFVKSADSLYIILEFCEQGSLHSICKNFGKFPENLVALYTAQVLQGLLFLHQQGVIHRDIKGANILTTKEGLVKLADFGVATKQQGLAEGSVVGTPYWMAPEVIELSGATTASDIWSLGCTVIELLDGKPPYHKFAPMPALFRIVNDDHPPLPEGASPLVRDFLMQCFQKDPNLRISAKKLLKHPWIVSAKKSDVRKPTEYDEAIKSVQEWNEALKASPPPIQSGHAGARKAPTRPGSRASGTSTKPGLRTTKSSAEASSPPAKPQFRLGQRAAQRAEIFKTPPEHNDAGDNWDSDFHALSESVSALQISHHHKPQDNFAGLFSSEKLKQYANFDVVPEVDGIVEEWDDEFEGELTVRSPLLLTKGDAVETVRPFYPPQSTTDDIKHNPPQRQTKKEVLSENHERKSSRDSQTKTQILRPSKNQTPTTEPTTASHHLPKSQTPALPQHNICEDEDEDYSDLVPIDEEAFQKKVALYSPSKPFNANDLHSVQKKMSGSMRRRATQTPTQLVHDAAAMRRTRSSLEIQKYAEDDDDDDFTDLHFDAEQPINLQAASNKGRSPHSAVSAGSDSVGSERGTLKLSNSVSWGDDEEDDDDDPFAALEEELDEVDLESNVARDKYARLCTLVEGLVFDLKLGQPEDVLAEIVEQLLQILFESPDVKSVIVSSHGMLPILEILETATRPHIILRLLKIVNCIISNNIEVQQNLCFVGGIPIITRFAHKKYSSEIRLEAAAFVRMMYETPTLTLQMFVSCGGLNVLVEFLEEDYDSEAGRELVLVGVDGIWSVFELQGPTPKNDFCRIFSRSSVLYPLSLVLNRILDEPGELAEVIQGRIVNIFLLFSQAENHVKETVADRMVLKRVLKDLGRMKPNHQITMLKFIKNLSMLATTLDALQNSNAIEVLTDLLGASMKLPHSREISNQVLNTMYNLCRLSKARQEDAALSGVIPLLQRIVQTERPLKEFALPILCDMAHSGKVGRKILWQNKGLQFYVSLLADQYWAVTALDAIFVWLQEETAKVEEHLLAPSSKFADTMVLCFNESKADAFELLLEPLQKLLRLSPPVAASLAHRSLFERSAVKLHARKALVRLNLLRVIRSICDACEERGELLRQNDLLESIQDLAKHDPAILVREMANELVKSSEYHSTSVSTSGGVRSSYAGFRRSSVSTANTASPLLSSTPLESSHTPPAASLGGRRGYFDLPTARTPAGAASSPYHRPVSRDSGSGSGSSLSTWNEIETSTITAGSAVSSSANSAAKRTNSRLNSRQTTTSFHNRPNSRLSLASAAGGGGGSSLRANAGSPTHPPPSANTRSSHAATTAAAAMQQRRRRQTSGAELGR